MRHIKNIFRLPRIYVPLFLSALLISLLALISLSVKNSCITAKEELKNVYSDIELTVTLISQLGYVQEEGGDVERAELNQSILGSHLLELLGNCSDVSSVGYLSEGYLVYVSEICTEDEYEAVRTALSNGETISQYQHLYYYENVLAQGINYFSMVGMTDPDMIYECLSTNREVNVVYFSEERLNGIILPIRVYEEYGQPENLVFCWRYPNIVNSGSDIFDEEGNLLSEYTVARIEKALQSELPTPLVVPVIGYYDDLSSDDVYCSGDIWEQLYDREMHDYIDLSEQEKVYNVFDDNGLVKVTATVASPDKAEDVIKYLISSGINTKDYLIVAQDYDYKFALAQVDSIESFADTIYVAALIFGAIIIIVIVSLSVKKRENEIYTLRTVGEKAVRIKAGITAEIILVTLSGMLIGTGICTVMGQGIFLYINNMTLQKAGLAAAKLTDLAQIIEEGAERQMQLQSAVDKFLVSGFSLEFVFDWRSCTVLGVMALVAAVYTWIAISRITSKNLMKRGD